MAVMKTEGGIRYPASAYLVVENPQQPSTWHLRVRDAAGKPDHRLMGAAAAALGPKGYRGNRYQGPQKTEAIRKLKALYKSEGMEYPSGDDTGSGGKDRLRARLAERPDLAQAAQAILSDFIAGQKAGRKHSRETLDAVRHVVTYIVSYFGLAADDPDNDGDSDQDGDAGQASGVA